MTQQYKKKLIEVALPLPELNDASAYDKMPGIGPHPKGIHHWWARLPLPTARAILFASVVDDPESHPEKWPTEAAQTKERERLFNILRRMMNKKLHDHPGVYKEAHEEMLKQSDGRLPVVFDPFSGGGSIPLEASRLGLKAHAGDLNPVAVLLNKCNLELAPRWTGRAPVNPVNRKQIGGDDGWRGTSGLAADVRHYSKLVTKAALEKLGSLYSAMTITSDAAHKRPDLQPYIGKSLPVVAWIWARTVASPNPAVMGNHVPLVSTFWLSTKKGKEAWLLPLVDRVAGKYRFAVQMSVPTDKSQVGAGSKRGRGARFQCLISDVPMDDVHIKTQGKQGALGTDLLAVVVDGPRGRIYVPATADQMQRARVSPPEGVADEALADDPRNIWCIGYGLLKIKQLFSPRQLTTLAALSDIIRGLRKDIQADASRSGLAPEEAAAYARTVSTFLALALDRCADFNNSLCRWSPSNEKVMNLFSRQAIPMVWDFAEANLLGDCVGSWTTCSDYVADCIEVITTSSQLAGHASQTDAAKGPEGIRDLLVSTDPPYYDNISYAGLSDFFYVWLRRTVGDLYPDIFATVLVPKSAELTASPERFEGDKKKAKEHFETGFHNAFVSLKDKLDPRYPLTVYYAFKQDDEDIGEGRSDELDLTTGWETLLDALIGSGFQITATWPVRASQKWRMVSMGTNALASYIVLACRPRPETAPQTDRRSFIAALRQELPLALRHLQQGNIAPVDFAQAALGPGMAVFSKYRRILESDGRTMTVRTALGLINQTLTEVLSELEDDFDAETRWAIAWFDQYGFGTGAFGDAEVLSKAKVTSVNGMQQAGIVISKGGEVRLVKPEELAANWDPLTDPLVTVWETVHHLIRALTEGESAAAELAAKLGSKADIARELAYRLFALCERKKRANEALSYNALVLSWPEIVRLARQTPVAAQAGLFEEN